MRICFFGSRMDLASGHSRPAFELASALIDRGHDVRILSTTLSPSSTVRFEEGLAKNPRLARIPVDRPFSRVRELLQPRSAARDLVRAKLAGCDIVHAHSLYAASVLGTFAPASAPYILTLNTDFQPPLRDYVTMLRQAPFYLTQLRYSAPFFVPNLVFLRAFRRFDRIVCWTGFLHDKLLSLGVPAEKVTRLPVGIDLTDLDLHDARMPEGSPLYLYSGVLSRLRGIAVLLRAFRVVKEIELSAGLIIADRGPHSARDRSVHAREVRWLERQIDAHGLGDSVIRSESGGDLSGWTHACDVVVLPFNTTIGYSQPPLTLLEGMAHGKPVISTRIGSVTEHVQDGVSGLLVDPGDVEGLATAMLRLTPQASRRMGRNARAQIEANHNWEQVAAATESVYASALSKKNPSRQSQAGSRPASQARS